MGITVLCVSLVASFLPVVWMFLNSFRTNDEIFLRPLAIPSRLDFGVFVGGWQRAKFTFAFRNSIINSVATVVMVLIVGSLAAFPLARMKFPGRKFLLNLLLLSIIVSAQVVLIPLFYVMTSLNLYNTLASTILANGAMALPLCIYLFFGFFREIPVEIEESTFLDGCRRLKFFSRFVIPLSGPIISTVSIFVFLWSWNEYLFALTFLKLEQVRTIPVQLQTFFARFAVEYNMLFATLSISIVPVLVLYVLFQKAFIKGLTAGAVKL